MDVLKKIAYLGLGAMFMTKEKISQVVNKKKKKGEITQEEGEKIFNELMEKGKKQKQEMDRMVEQKVQEVIERMNIATKKDIQNVNKQIQQLSEKIDQYFASKVK